MTETITDYDLVFLTGKNTWLVVDNHTGNDLGEFWTWQEAEDFAENWIVEMGY